MHPILSEVVQGIPIRREIRNDVAALLSHHRCSRTLEHSRRVAAEVRRLARHWRSDGAQAETAGWLHDISAIIPVERRIGVAEALGIEVLAEMSAAAERSLDRAAAVYLRHLWTQRDRLPVLHPWMAHAYEELVGESQEGP